MILDGTEIRSYKIMFTGKDNWFLTQEVSDDKPKAPLKNAT